MKTKPPIEVDCVSCGKRVSRDQAISLSVAADICHDCIRKCVKLMDDGGKDR